MSGKEENRIVVRGLPWDVTERQLENAFDRYGKVVECQVMLERDTGRPLGFGFITFSDRRTMENAIREMHGRELGDRIISVKMAQPKMGRNDLDQGYMGGGGGGYGGDRPVGQDECFKCGRPGHWDRDCPSAGGRGGSGSFSSSRSRFGCDHGDFFGNRDRNIDDRYDGGRFGDRVCFDSRDKYGTRDRYAIDRKHDEDNTTVLDALPTAEKFARRFFAVKREKMKMKKSKVKSMADAFEEEKDLISGLLRAVVVGTKGDNVRYAQMALQYYQKMKDEEWELIEAFTSRSLWMSHPQSIDIVCWRHVCFTARPKDAECDVSYFFAELLQEENGVEFNVKSCFTFDPSECKGDVDHGCMICPPGVKLHPGKDKYISGRPPFGRVTWRCK